VGGVHVVGVAGTWNTTHRSANGTAWNSQFYALVWREGVDAACGKQIRRGLGTAQDLEQHRDGRGVKGDAINKESRASIVLSFHVRFTLIGTESGNSQVRRPG
jgi:hypothetical protein